MHAPPEPAVGQDGRMRVFVSIRPSADARLHLQNALDEVRQTAGQSLRWGDADQWHLTLAFRPDLPEGAVPDALDDLAAMASGHGPLTLHLSGAGSFSGRTLWIGVGGRGQPAGVPDARGAAGRARPRAPQGSSDGRSGLRPRTPPAAAPHPLVGARTGPDPDPAGRRGPGPVRLPGTGVGVHRAGAGGLPSRPGPLRRAAARGARHRAARPLITAP